MQRRSFFGGIAGIVAAGYAPAIGHSGVLMPVRRLIVPPRLMVLSFEAPRTLMPNDIVSATFRDERTENVVARISMPIRWPLAGTYRGVEVDVDAQRITRLIR